MVNRKKMPGKMKIFERIDINFLTVAIQLVLIVNSKST